MWAVQTLRLYLEIERFTVKTVYNSVHWLMKITEPSESLVGWTLHISESDCDTRYVKIAKHSLADCITRTLSGDDTTVDTDQALPCFLSEPEGSEDNPEDEESVPVDTRVINSIFSWGYRPT